MSDETTDTVTEDDELAEADAEAPAPAYSENNPNHQPSPFDYDDRSMLPGEESRQEYVQHPPFVRDTIDTSVEGLPQALEHLPEAHEVSNLPDGGYVGTPTDGASVTPEDDADADDDAVSEDGLDEKNVDDLRQIASDEDVPGRSAMNKEELIQGIRDKRVADAESSDQS